MTNRATSPFQISATCDLSSPHHNFHYLLAGLLTAMGFSGTIAAIFSLYQPTCHTSIVLFTAGISFLLAVCLQLLLRHSGWVTLLFLLPIPAVMLLRMQQIVVGIQYFINEVYQLAHHTEVLYFTIQSTYDPVDSVTLAACCAVALLAFFFAFFTIRRPLFLLTAGVSFLLIEPGLYLGLSVQPIRMAPLIAYWCGMLAYVLTLHRKKDSSKTTPYTATVCSMVTTFFVLLVYLIVVLCGSFLEYQRSAKDQKRAQDLSNSLSAFDLQSIPDSLRNLGISLGILSDDQVSKLGTKSQLHFQDKTELTVSFSTLPDSTMYLKGYTGSVYTENQWEPLSEETAGARAETVSDIINTYDCAPQHFPFLFQRSILPDSDTFQCTIIPENPEARFYQPYVSYAKGTTFSDDASWKPADSDSYSWTVSAPQTWVIPTISQTELQSSTFAPTDLGNDTVIKQFLRALQVSDDDTISIQTRFSPTTAADTPEEIQGKVIPAMLMESLVYRDFVKEAYTVLPDTVALDDVYAALPSTVTAQKPQTPQEQYDALCAIRDWMASLTEYTTSPGKTPSTRDFVSFFLLENHKGYCMHYATAGTILARYLGIPARYCEGYLVGNDILSNAEQTEGGYTASLTDRQAHAWCEYYIDGYGWMPFEMTPGYYGTAAAEQSISGTVTTEVSQQSGQTTTIQVQSTTQSTAVQQTDSSHSATQTTGAVLTTSSVQDSTQHSGSGVIPLQMQKQIILVAVILFFIGSCILARRWHVQRRTHKLFDMQHPKRALFTSYQYLLQLLRFCGIPYRGQLPLQYCDEAIQHLTGKGFSAEAPERIIPLMLAADFGDALPTKTELTASAKTVQALAQTIYTSCNPIRRICMKYFLHLI